MSMREKRGLRTGVRQLAAMLCMLFLVPVDVSAEEGRGGGETMPPTSTTLVFTTFPRMGMGDLFERILIEAYAELGYTIKTERVPAQRALVMANQGDVDGEAARVPVVEARNPNLIRVPTPLYVNRVAVFTRNTSIDTSQGWDALKGHKLGVAIGYKYIEGMTRRMDRIRATDYTQLFFMLAENRLDAVVAEYFEALPNTKSHRLEGVVVLQPFLARKEMYHYLHKKHAHLVPRIDAVLCRMRADGRMEAIIRAMEAEYGFGNQDVVPLQD